MQYNKVEISGVNTSELKVLKEAEKMELLKLAQTGDKLAREKLVVGNLRLVLSVIQRFAGRGENFDDIFQVGVIGLLKAVDNFNTELDVRFSTYAVPLIMGEVRRYLRDNSPIKVSRSIKDVAYKAMQAKEKLIIQNQKEPTVEELSAEIGIPKRVIQYLAGHVEGSSITDEVYIETSFDFVKNTLCKIS